MKDDISGRTTTRRRKYGGRRRRSRMRALAKETGLEFACRGTHRWIAQREFETVDLEIDGETDEVTVKIASDADGEVYDGSAEYEDAKAVARETDRPVRDVIDWAESIVLS